MVLVAGFSIWGGIAFLGIALIVLAGLIVLVDSWVNRNPVKKKPAPRYRDDRRAA